MQTKWTALSVTLLFVFVGIVPLVASGGQGPSFWMWFNEAITPEGDQIGTLFNWVLLLCGVLFVGIHAAMLYFVVAYRKGVREETSDVHGHLGIELTWTIIPTIIMVLLGIYSFNVYSQVIQPDEDPLQVDVTALQFAWRVHYPDSDIQMSNRMVLPTERAVRLSLESEDVLHSFFVPQFRVKQDVVPGMTTRLNVSRIRRTGQYSIKCAELCGVGHYRMLADLTVVTPKQFKQWKSLPSAQQRRDFIQKVTQNES